MSEGHELAGRDQLKFAVSALCRVLLSRSLTVLRSRRAWASGATIAVLVSALNVPTTVALEVAGFGFALIAVLAAFVLARLLANATIWLLWCARREVSLTAHSTGAAVLAVRRGEKVGLVGAVTGQIGRFARHAVVRDAREGEGLLRLFIPSRTERAELTHQIPGLRPISRFALDAEPLPAGSGTTLGRGELPGVVAQIIRSFARESVRSSGVVALNGPWGAGKSWVLDRVIGELECAAPDLVHVRTVRFNPWLYSDEGSLFAGFAQVLANEIEDRRSRGKLLRALQVIGPAAKLGPVDLSGAIRNLSDLFDPNGRSASVVAQVVSKSVRRNGPLCILVDDVDRLTTDELLTLFKLVRLLGNVPGLNYVLAFDEQLVLSLLTRTTFAADSPVRARAFLEKIVERKIAIPPLTALQARAQLIEPVMTFPEKIALRVKDNSLARLEEILSSIVVPELITIRSAERFVESTLDLPVDLHGEVDWGDWVLVCWIRVFAPSLWIWIIENRDELVGSSRRYNPLEKRPAVEGGRALGALGFDEPLRSILQDVLEALFPRVRRESANIFIPSTSEDEAKKRQGVGAAGYFDRYVWGTLPPGQVPDMRIVAELRRLALDSSGHLEGSARLQALYVEDGDAVIQMMSANTGDSSMNWIAALEFLRVNRARAGESRRQGDSVARKIAVHGFYESDDHARSALLDLAERNPASWWGILSDIRRGELPPERSQVWGQRLARITTLAVEELLVALRAGPAPGVTDIKRLFTFYDLRNIDLAAANRLLSDQVDEGCWPIEAAIGSLVKLYGSGSEFHLRGLPIDEVLAVFGESRLTEALCDITEFELTRDYWDLGHTYESVPADEENLLEIVRGGLIQWKKQRGDGDPSIG
ncbi:KAP family P-loop NTPase fold protein [Curtobacterium flaccumfaciens]|nr:P-loop NTPase fold protein [Curtobacterium flaccumfaciens]